MIDPDFRLVFTRERLMREAILEQLDSQVETAFERRSKRLIRQFEVQY
jgi:hypothetical protein